MLWNWQQPDWPKLSWEVGLLGKAESAFLLKAGAYVGLVQHLDQADREQVTIEAMSTEALTTSEIEGEMLDRASVQSSIRRQLGLDAGRRRVRPAERGVAEMMIDVHRAFVEPLRAETLFRWHRMLLQGRRDLHDVGRYRTVGDPMQIVSGQVGAPTVHFEAPPAARVPDEMERFLDWFNSTAPEGSGPLPALARAGAAHLYFESIHPFEDGNGRIGRAIAQVSLAQSLGQPTLIALAATVLARRRTYYDALAAASRSTEISRWLSWFSETVLDAQDRTAALVQFILAKTRLLDRLRGQLNERQRKALLRVLREGPAGFQGGLSAGNYMTITGASPATTTRDLADLVAKGALIRSGERRHARYYPPFSETT
jgi:Fic family protein